MSNVAAANILLPSLACVGPTKGKAALYVLAPVALSVSMALLFPMGTPPNAIVLSNGNATLRQMVVVGSVLTVVLLITILCWCFFVLPVLYGNIDHVNSAQRAACHLL